MRVCVVGSGISGLPAIKACLEEGLEVVCYERSNDLGGLWNYRPDNEVALLGGTVMRATINNTSKEMMAYSDYPPDENMPNFMPHYQLLQYLRDYAEKFDLTRHIRFNSTVKMITETGDGHWKVELENGGEEIFDRLMLATGNNADPRRPQIKGMDQFKGRIMHSHDYRDWSGMEGKDVVILGIGNSALDVAVDLARIAKSVTISTRRGAWLFNRAAQGGMPYDAVIYTRLYEWLLQKLPWSMANDFIERKLQQRMDHDAYGLRPTHRFFQQRPTVNDAMTNLLCAGLIKITDDVVSFTEDTVILKGGKALPCDVFIACTGYTFDIPYLQKGIIPIKDEAADLYKYVFPINRDDVAVIGLILPMISIAPMNEMQARWSARVFAGRLSLPSANERRQSIARKNAAMARRHYDGKERSTLLVNYLGYMDDLAERIGCHPHPQQYLTSDPLFALRLLIGPNAPYVYRLEGPHKWSGARAAIERLPDRIKKPLKKRQDVAERGNVDVLLQCATAKVPVLLLFTSLWFLCSSLSTLLHPLVYLLLIIIFLCLFSFLQYLQHHTLTIL